MSRVIVFITLCVVSRMSHAAQNFSVCQQDGALFYPAQAIEARKGEVEGCSNQTPLVGMTNQPSVKTGVSGLLSHPKWRLHTSSGWQAYAY